MSRPGTDLPRNALPQGRMFKPPGWQWFQAGEVGWWIRPGWEDKLLGPEGLRLHQWRDEGRLVEIKRSPQRVVYRVDLPERTVYIKHYLVPGWRERLRQWFRRGKGRNEGKRAEQLARMGIPTIEPVALGEQRKRRFLFENYLVSPAIEGVLPLDRFVEEELPLYPPQRRLRIVRRLAETLGKLTARQHNAGLEHADYHPGNLLVHLDELDEPHLSMIDLDALRFRKRMSPRRRIENLALLNHYFWIRSSRAERIRFLHAYLAESTAWKIELSQLALEIETRTRAWAERLWRRWGRRCTTSNKYFEEYRTKRYWAIASRSIDPKLVISLIENPERPWSEPGTRIIKESRTSRVGEVSWLVNGREQRVIYKRFNVKRWFEPIQALFRPSRGWRSWRAAHHMLSRGLPTPENLLIIGSSNKRWFGWISKRDRSTYLATLKIESSMTLSNYLREVAPTLSDSLRQRAYRTIVHELARLVRTMHDRSISDRDLKATNILVEGDPTQGKVRLTLIDLVGTSLRHPLPTERRVQNLSRILLSLSECHGWSRSHSLRLLKCYLGSEARRPGTLKKWWHQLTIRHLRKRRQNERRGRLLS